MTASGRNPFLVPDRFSRRGRLAAALWASLLLGPLFAYAASFPALRGHGGAVASSENDATEIGLEILRSGGNAVDAAIATALALAVVHPEAGNLGGGGFAVVRFGDEFHSLDFRERAPAGARPDLYLDAEGKPVPEASRLGPLAAGVPGTPEGLWALHQRLGRLSWSDIVAPAVHLAADGFALSRRTWASLVDTREELARFPATAEIWLPNGGEPPDPGARIRIPALAAALAAYRDDGPQALTSGSAALAIEATSRQYGGILTAQDLADYEPLWRQPVRFDAFGWSFVSMDLPTSGGIILGQCLRQLEALGWSEQPRFGAARAHLLAEVLRRSYADRYLLGDPETTFATSSQLLAESWLSRRRSTIDTSRATPSTQVRPKAAQLPIDTDNTTHLSVVDSEGNFVSMTTTLNGSFGCKVIVPELGYFLNNEMDDFATAPGLPNDFGLVQGEANVVDAGKRMLSSMTPTIAWRDGETLAIGARGGSRIPTATLQVLLNVIVDADPLQAAVNRPRLHHQWLPDLLRAEPDALSPETRRALEELGHRVEVWTRDAKVNAVRRLPDGSSEAASDPRGPAAAGVLDPVP